MILHIGQSFLFVFDSMKILTFNTSKERNMFVTERFLSNVVEKRVCQITCCTDDSVIRCPSQDYKFFETETSIPFFLNKRMKKSLLKDNTIHQKEMELYYFDVITFHVERKITR